MSLESLRPTPELSFAVRHFLGILAGGYDYSQPQPLLHLTAKVYGEDGGQMPPADADAHRLHPCDWKPFAIEVADGSFRKLLAWLKWLHAVDAEYLKEVKDVNINQNWLMNTARARKIVHSLHAIGEMLPGRALA